MGSAVPPFKAEPRLPSYRCPQQRPKSLPLFPGKSYPSWCRSEVIKSQTPSTKSFCLNPRRHIQKVLDGVNGPTNSQSRLRLFGTLVFGQEEKRTSHLVTRSPCLVPWCTWCAWYSYCKLCCQKVWLWLEESPLSNSTNFVEQLLKFC